jgi:hypothetical protein
MRGLLFTMSALAAIAATTGIAGANVGGSFSKSGSLGNDDVLSARYTFNTEFTRGSQGLSEPVSHRISGGYVTINASAFAALLGSEKELIKFRVSGVSSVPTGLQNFREACIHRIENGLTVAGQTIKNESLPGGTYNKNIDVFTRQLSSATVTVASILGVPVKLSYAIGASAFVNVNATAWCGSLSGSMGIGATINVTGSASLDVGVGSAGVSVSLKLLDTTVGPSFSSPLTFHGVSVPMSGFCQFDINTRVGASASIVPISGNFSVFAQTARIPCINPFGLFGKKGLCIGQLHWSQVLWDFTASRSTVNILTLKDFGSESFTNLSCPFAPEASQPPPVR